MNTFDDIPEDDQESYPCSCGGNIIKEEIGVWECDTCNIIMEDKTQ